MTARRDHRTEFGYNCRTEAIEKPLKESVPLARTEAIEKPLRESVPFARTGAIEKPLRESVPFARTEPPPLQLPLSLLENRIPKTEAIEKPLKGSVPLARTEAIEKLLRESVPLARTEAIEKPHKGSVPLARTEAIEKPLKESVPFARTEPPPLQRPLSLLENRYPMLGQRGGLVSASNSRSGGRRFDSRPSHVAIALEKKFTITFPSPPSCKMGTQLQASNVLVC
ncbi:ribosome-binding protein 1 [Elysia marginata]|uniref:Ribosome-binding protein 1 n=1 Tax=Elysia marginata TaxID=1093978 RepID=A0AAV4EUW5_9GAST|nr:ribosome-binding protein 1 [Elysia marginata]